MTHHRIPVFFFAGCLVFVALLTSESELGTESNAPVTAPSVTSYAADEKPLDLIIRGGMVYDGSGERPRRADVGVRNDRIEVIGDLSGREAGQVIDAKGMAVAPGFINVLSWATTSLIQDGHSQSDMRQGVTLEIFGEGWSMGPWTESMRQDVQKSQGDYKYPVNWTSLSDYLEKLTQRGVSCNVASFIGATTVRINVLGYANRPPSAKELDRMKALVRKEMEGGALGIGSSLIYAPAFYAKTDELIALCKVAGEYGGVYISHMRSEGNQILQAVDELITIAEKANISAEIYHLKAAGRHNWKKLGQVIKRVEAARAKGLRITANMYTYTAGATGLNASMPPWVQEGGFNKWRDRLRDPKIRDRVAKEMRTSTNDWENLLLMAGSPEKVLLVGFANDDLKHLTGKTLAQVAKQRGKTAEETAMDLVVQDGSRVECVYFLMSEENVKKKITLPWVSFCSDSASLAPEGPFLKSNPHPRAYGSFARLLGRYVRDEKVIPLEAAIRKLSNLPARNFRLQHRGMLAPGYFADIVVFDPKKIRDNGTYERPHQYATGMRHVFVNGVQTIKDGEHTGAKPGRVVWGPGKKNNRGKSARVRLPVVLTDEARRIHAAALVIDGHNDLPWQMRNKASRSFEKMDISRPQKELHTDIPRLKQGGLGAQFWSVYVPAETAQTPGRALQETLEQIELVHAMIKKYPETFELASTSEDVLRIHKQGKIASMIGVEGGHSIENSIQVLRQLYKLGARYMTLTHSDTLGWADSATDKPQHGGLTKFGEEVVREMNRLGMLVDLSHVSDETMRDALRVTQAPIIYSHSSARAIANHPRNVPDDILRLVKKNHGVVMINYFSGFVVPEAAEKMATMFAVSRELRKKFPADSDYRKARRAWQLKNPIPAGTIHDVVDHIDHVIRIAGIDHVGLGSDFDGVSKLPLQLHDVSTYPIVTQELLNRGYTRQQIHKILGGNVLRVMQAAEKVARELTRKR